jgi:glycerol kinase
VRDERFLSPARIDEEIRAVTGMDARTPHAVVARSIVESVAAAVAGVVEELRLQLRVDELAAHELLQYLDRKSAR